MATYTIHASMLYFSNYSKQYINTNQYTNNNPYIIKLVYDRHEYVLVAR